MDRRGLWRALTPQVFAFAALRQALKEARRAGMAVTDEAQAMERIGAAAALVPRLAIQHQSDARRRSGVAEQDTDNDGEAAKCESDKVSTYTPSAQATMSCWAACASRIRSGVVAHSDGDVVIHALCDALLGALGDGDIGQHFPDTRSALPRRGQPRVLARRGGAHAGGGTDAWSTRTSPCSRKHRGSPRIAPPWRQNLAADLGVAAQLINIKATTTERLGFIGRGEGLAALASVLLGR